MKIVQDFPIFQIENLESLIETAEMMKTALIFNEIHPVLLRIPGGFSIFCNL